MDTLYDYFKIKFIFENYNNKTTTNWFKLCKDLKKIKKIDIEKLIKNKFRKIILGTAQFGFQYGINNQKKKIKMKDISEILNYAKQNYIKFLDTANAYYNSEKRIGKYLSTNQNDFKIISKIKISEIEKIKNSLNKLELKKLESILIHDPHQIRSDNDIEKFKRKIHRYKNLYNNIGVSLNDPKDYYRLRHHKIFRVIQIPYNIFDKRWEKLLKNKKKNIEIHARSIFLQGLLITEDKNCPKN